MISHQHKCIFIHINKCCGTSIIETVPHSKHKPHRHVSYYKNGYSEVFDEYFKFSILRNPWDRMVSFYHFHIQRGWHLNWDWDINDYPDFNEFVSLISDYSKSKEKSIFKGDRGHPVTHTMRMSNGMDWLTDKDGNLLVDYIGRFEEIEKSFSYIANKIGLQSCVLPRTNNSTHDHYSVYYTKKSRDIVADRFSKDIAYFDYKFEGVSA